jgi:hypothetical protein
MAERSQGGTTEKIEGKKNIKNRRKKPGKTEKAVDSIPRYNYFYYHFYAF